MCGINRLPVAIDEPAGRLELLTARDQRQILLITVRDRRHGHVALMVVLVDVRQLRLASYFVHGHDFFRLAPRLYTAEVVANLRLPVGLLAVLLPNVSVRLHVLEPNASGFLSWSGLVLLVFYLLPDLDQLLERQGAS